MLLITILIALLIQRWMGWGKHLKKDRFLQLYYDGLKARCAHWSVWQGGGSVLLLLLPLLLIYVILATLLYYYTFSNIGYYVLTLLIVLYCMDARPLSDESTQNRGFHDILIYLYQRIFALIFWLLILGALGVLLYASLAQFENLLKERRGHHDESAALLVWTTKLRAILDWIPVRLLGITYAMAGQFSPVFQVWYDHLYEGLSDLPEQVVACGLMALGHSLPQSEDHAVLTHKCLEPLNSLVNRSLSIWLLIIGVFSIGFWFG